jgi:ribosomal protein L3 glutamine methyltransferase
VSAINATLVATQLQTIGDYIRYATSEFNRAELFFGHGTDNARDEAINLVLFALYLPYQQQLDQFLLNCRLIEDEKKAVLALINRRIEERIPAAYITNQTSFANLPFYVDERVLVPRSPIAELIENRFQPYLPAQPKRILDLCTGSACIAIACAYAFPDAEIDALDLSIDALNVAQINIENHGLLAQVTPIQSDVFSAVEGLRYDLIVTNPPYVDLDDVMSMPDEYQHEPAMGLGCGNDGLDIVRKILAEAENHLTEQGILVCEVGNSQIHVEAVYPEVPFTWLEFSRGGHGVFLLTKAQLTQYSTYFKERATS